MSLQINLSSAALKTAYLDVLNGPNKDWVIYTYEAGSNDLKVQATGDGGLEELEEEFSDGRIQYAFARVVDPNSNLPKYVQINWCGDGVPEAKKGLFHTHSSAVGRQLLHGAHVVLSARNEEDVTPELIMKRVEAASGARYTAQKEAPRKYEPIAPVRSSYTPVGRVDIAALKATKTTPSPSAATSRPPLPNTSRPTFGASKPTTASAASLYGRTVTASKGPAPADAWPEENPVITAPPPPPPPPPASRPPVLPTAPRPTPSTTSVPVSTVPTKPTEDDLIAPVGTAYTPVSLPAPKKLKNPFEGRFQQQEEPQRVTPVRKGLTWSERHALAKKQTEQEESRSLAAQTSMPSPSPARKFGVGAAAIAVGGAAVGFGAAAVVTHSSEPEYNPEPEEAAVRFQSLCISFSCRYDWSSRFLRRLRLRLLLRL
ncbi:hypothetical protein DFS33DRAFT_1339060 [Desarmillaria ectypa]|nr:hypothetical protein DFS33DRAFT_1339060 [Desarmillaria ectypa]